MSLDFGNWLGDIRLNSWLANLLNECWFLFDRLHELGDWWWLLFDNREFTLLDSGDRLGERRSSNWSGGSCGDLGFLSGGSGLALLCFDGHQFFGDVLLELVHV